MLNCVDGSNTSFLNCTRLVLAANQVQSHPTQTTGMSFSNISSGSYSVYAVETNDYFMRPINTTKGVRKWSAEGSVAAALRLFCGVLLLLLLLLAAL